MMKIVAINKRTWFQTCSSWH